MKSVKAIKGGEYALQGLSKEDKRCFFKLLHCFGELISTIRKRIASSSKN